MSNVDWKALKQKKQKQLDKKLSKQKYNSHLEYVQKNIDKLEKNLFNEVRTQEAGTTCSYHQSACLGPFERVSWVFDVYKNHWCDERGEHRRWLSREICDRLSSKGINVKVDDDSHFWVIQLP